MAAADGPHHVYVSIGSNIDRERNVAGSLTALVEAFGEIEASSVYESASEGYEGAPYYNLVVHFTTSLPPGAVNSVLHRIEDLQGRVRGAEKFVDRTLDIDILLYDDLQGEFDGIHLPRDEIAHAAHVLLPLTEIAGEKAIPGTGATAAQLWRDLAPSIQRIDAVPFTWRGAALPAILSS